jgi:hypothetical protein
VTQERLIPELAGWSVEPEPDGSVRLTPEVRVQPGASPTILVSGLSVWAVCGVLLVRALLSGDRAIMPALILLFAASLPLGGLLVWQGLWELFGREEWYVGADRLEVRQSLFGFRRRRRYRGAALELVYSPADSWIEDGRYFPGYTYRQRHLTRAEAVGDPKTWWGLFIVAGGRRRCLQSSSRRPLTRKELHTLGAFLSARAGWPLRVRKG